MNKTEQTIINITKERKLKSMFQIIIPNNFKNTDGVSMLDFCIMGLQECYRSLCRFFLLQFHNSFQVLVTYQFKKILFKYFIQSK